MRNYLLINSLFIFLLTSFSLQAQEKKGEELINLIKENYSRVKDYKTDAEITVNLDFIKVAPMKATVYYKSPDKFKLDTKDFAMLPKEAINFTPMNFDEGDNTVLFIKNEIIENEDLSIIKVIPNGDGKLLASTLWINEKKKRISKFESVMRKGIIRVNFNYDDKINYPLPQSINIEMDIPRFNKKTEENKNSDNEIDKEPNSIKIKYSGYKINEGIDDDFFENK